MSTLQDRRTIHTDQAPAAIGPYSQAVQIGNLVFLSGQIALEPGTMELTSGDITTETRQVFANIRAVARAAGGDLENLVKVTVYLTDLSHFQTVNSVMESLFQEPYPARAAIGVSALPRGAAVEIEGILYVADG